MRARWAAFLLASALTLAACGGGGSSAKQSPTPSKTARPAHVISAAAAKKAVLTIRDVGDPLKQVSYHPPRTPLYCAAANAPTLAKETSSTGIVGVWFSSKDPEATIIEEIYLYKSAADARAALTATQNDLDCATGHTYNSDGTSNVIGVGAGQDYSARLTADYAYGWSLRTADTRSILLAVLTHNTMILLNYKVGTKTDASKLPDAFDLAGTAYDRLNRA